MRTNEQGLEACGIPSSILTCRVEFQEREAKKNVVQQVKAPVVILLPQVGCKFLIQLPTNEPGKAEDEGPSA